MSIKLLVLTIMISKGLATDVPTAVGIHVSSTKFTSYEECKANASAAIETYKELFPDIPGTKYQIRWRCFDSEEGLNPVAFPIK